MLSVRVGAGAVWASLWGMGLLRIDPAANRVVATIAIDNITAPPAVTGTGVWAPCCGTTTTRPGGRLVRSTRPATGWWPGSGLEACPMRSEQAERGLGGGRGRTDVAGRSGQ